MKNLDTLIFYITASCNLQCRYCFIDKNPALIKIDQELEKSFQDNDYYINFSKELVENKNSLTKVEFWGGEPSYGLYRIHNLTKQLIEYYPNLNDFFMSSNMTMDNFIEQFYGFLKILGQYPNREFNFTLQMSLDGPSYINDFNRGIGTTEKFTKNFVKLITTIEKEILNKYSNIKLKVFFKPTWDIDTINKLNNKQKIIEYYQFFESYYDIIRHIKNNNFSYSKSIPNTACPSPHTKQDGKLFASIIKKCKEIEKENLEKKYFKYYEKITPYSYFTKFNCNNCDNRGNCGSGKNVIGLLPNKNVSLCHNGFVELLTDYKNYCLNHNFDHSIDFNLFNNKSIKNEMIFSYLELNKYEKIVNSFFDKNQNYQTYSLISQIQFLASCNQIDKKYLKNEEAKKAANFILLNTSYCLRDNLGITGSRFLQPNALIKLLLNGAIDFILEEREEENECC